MKIATYNVNSIRIRLDAIISWLEKHQPDVLCIQETKCQNELFPLLVLQSTGYKVYYRGMKSYNGVAVLTRVEPDGVFHGFDDQLPEIDDARLMRVAVGGIPIINTYVPRMDGRNHDREWGCYFRRVGYHCSFRNDPNSGRVDPNSVMKLIPFRLIPL